MPRSKLQAPLLQANRPKSRMFGDTVQLLSLFKIILNNFTWQRLKAAFDFFAAVAFTNVCCKFEATITTGTPKSEEIHTWLLVSYYKDFIRPRRQCETKLLMNEVNLPVLDTYSIFQALVQLIF